MTLSGCRWSLSTDAPRAQSLGGSPLAGTRRMDGHDTCGNSKEPDDPAVLPRLRWRQSVLRPRCRRDVTWRCAIDPRPTRNTESHAEGHQDRRRLGPFDNGVGAGVGRSSIPAEHALGEASVSALRRARPLAWGSVLALASPPSTGQSSAGTRVALVRDSSCVPLSMMRVTVPDAGAGPEAVQDSHRSSCRSDCPAPRCRWCRGWWSRPSPSDRWWCCGPATPTRGRTRNPATR